jgi:predicted deacetylase
LSKNEQRRRAEAVAAVEAEVSAAERRVIELTEAMQAAAEAQDYAGLQELTAAYEATEARVVELLEQWEALAHEPDHHRSDG